VLRHLRVRDVVVLGWSLGGHVALELLARPDSGGSSGAVVVVDDAAGPRVRGAMLVGTPPVGHDEVARGFKFGEGAEAWRRALAARDDLSEADERVFAENCADPPYADWMLAAVRRTDPRARRIMFEAFAAGSGVDQRRLVGETPVLLAVVNGADEPFVNLEFVRQVSYRNLWRERCLELEGLKHAPFWAQPGRFADLLLEFLHDVSIPESLTDEVGSDGPRLAALRTAS
jgi:pimeloyl-ACP methyl ester carboxylesterase